VPDTLYEARDLGRDLAIASVRSTIVDVPTVRRHKLSHTSVTVQSNAIVQVRLAMAPRAPARPRRWAARAGS
jgi:muconate cycloisomerase